MCTIQNSICEHTDSLAERLAISEERLQMLDWDEVKQEIASLIDGDCTIFNHLLSLDDKQREHIANFFPGIIVVNKFISSSGIDIDGLKSAVIKKSEDLGFFDIDFEYGDTLLKLSELCDLAIDNYIDDLRDDF